MFGRIPLFSFGIVGMIIGVGGLLDVATKQNWPVLEARVLSVDVSCEMKATERGILSKTTSTATVPCDGVDLFKAMYPDQTWQVHTKYMGLLRLGAAGPTADLLLYKVDGRPPEAGDIVSVVQNPAKPSQIALASSRSLSNGLLFAGVGAVGALLFVLPLLGRRRRTDTAHEMPAPTAPEHSSRSYAEPPRYAEPTPAPRQPAPAQQTRRTFGRRNGVTP